MKEMGFWVYLIGIVESAAEEIERAMAGELQ